MFSITTYSGQIAKLLVFVVIFGTVAPAIALGTDSVVITNSVQSSSNTGGQTSSGNPGQNGQAGQAGEPGQSGQNGQNGQAGSSGIVIQGESTANTKVESTIDGEIIESVKQTVSGQENATASVALDYNSTISSGDVSNSQKISDKSFVYVLESLHSILKKYVAILF